VSDRRRERLTTTSTGPVRTLDLGRGSSIQGASQGETTLDLSDPPRQPRSPHSTDEDGTKVVTRDAKEVSDAVFDRLSAEFGDRIDAEPSAVLPSKRSPCSITRRFGRSSR
jgi:hypothetical protein